MPNILFRRLIKLIWYQYVKYNKFSINIITIITGNVVMK